MIGARGDLGCAVAYCASQTLNFRQNRPAVAFRGNGSKARFYIPAQIGKFRLEPLDGRDIRRLALKCIDLLNQCRILAIRLTAPHIRPQGTHARGIYRPGSASPSFTASGNGFHCLMKGAAPRCASLTGGLCAAWRGLGCVRPCACHISDTVSDFRFETVELVFQFGETGSGAGISHGFLLLF